MKDVRSADTASASPGMAVNAECHADLPDSFGAASRLPGVWTE